MRPGSADQGWLHGGPHGAGRFVKMVHYGIEHGLMAAYAEGVNPLHHANIGLHPHAADAETTPLREPAHHQCQMDLPEITELWRRGSVIGSWLLDLTATALAADPGLSGYGGRVSDTGERGWAVQAAIDEAVPGRFNDRFQVHGRRSGRGRPPIAGSRNCSPRSSQPDCVLERQSCGVEIV